MDKEFKLEIRSTKKDNLVVFYGCLSYIGNNKKLRSEIERIKQERLFYKFSTEPRGDLIYKTENLCLFKLELRINSQYNILEDVYYNDDEDSITYKIKHDCYLEYFFNETIEYKLQHFSEIKKLKGIGHSILCAVINEILYEKILTRDSIIALNASGEIQGKSIVGLVRYYEKLGFKQPFPELFNKFIEQQNVPMKARLGDIIDNCNIKELSHDVYNFYKGIEILRVMINRN